MQLQPRPETYPQIAKALKFFQVASVITGVMLFGLYIIAFIRWFLLSDVFLFGNTGLVSLTQLPPAGIETDFKPSGVNFTSIFLIAHGWFYVVYLLASFNIWSKMRWPFWRFLVLAASGCMVGVSFLAETWVINQVRELLKQAPAPETAQ